MRLSIVDNLEGSILPCEGDHLVCFDQDFSGFKSPAPGKFFSLSQIRTPDRCMRGPITGSVMRMNNLPRLPSLRSHHMAVPTPKGSVPGRQSEGALRVYLVERWCSSHCRDHSCVNSTSDLDQVLSGPPGTRGLYLQNQWPELKWEQWTWNMAGLQPLAEAEPLGRWAS